MTIGGKGLGSSAKVGDRIPAIWFHKTRGVLISTAMDGKASYSKFYKDLPPAGEWTSIEVSQTLISSQYMFSISIGRENVLTKPNSKPIDLTDVKVYAGSPWYSGQKGSIRSLKIEIKTPIDCVKAGRVHPQHNINQKELWYLIIHFAGPWSAEYSLSEEHQITRNKLLATIPILRKEWKVSFDFKANNFRGLTQVFHMTAGGKGAGTGAKYGDRTPAIWTHSSKGFLISSAVGGVFSYSKFFKPLPATGKWINIEVGQELVGTKMTYSIIINGKKVFSVTNSRPTEFENVKVFASSNWYSPISGVIKNLRIQNKNSGESFFCRVNHINSFPRHG